jgi:anti-sigma regulatory factor (Ser/Thr protein kinase)
VEISCQRGEGYVLVTPGGVGTPGDADTLHAVLLESFADGTDAVVCDVTCAGEPPEVRHALVDAVLAAADRIRGWPGGLLVVVGPQPAAAAGELPAGVVAVARLADAVRLVCAHPRARTAGEVLEPLLRAPALARAFLRRVLAGWGAGRFVDDALLVVDELVANAVLHAGTMIELRLALCPDRLGVAVADRSSNRPTIENADDAAEHGRGLLLVDAVATDWHVLPRRDGGKVVRAVLVATPATVGLQEAATSTATSAAGGDVSRSAAPRGGPSSAR